MKFSLFTKITIATASGVAIAFGSISLPAIANKQPVRQGLPGRRISGGVRSECFQDSTQSLVALTPRNLLGKTAQARPAFWFSLPETESAKSINFELVDSTDNIIYSTHVDSSQVSGLSRIELPESAPKLVLNENYRWVLEIDCERGPGYGSLVVQGWVRRVQVSAELNSQLSSAGLVEQAYLYEEADLWHERIDALAELRTQNPDSLDAQLKWAAFVQSLGLDGYLSSGSLETTIDITDASATYPAI